MVTIELQNLRMRAYHGFYEGEINTGSLYDVSIKVSYEEGRTDFSDIRQTINYAEVFDIIRQRMQAPTPLLEKVADGIIRRIKHQYPNTKEVVISIFKLQPPIESFEGKIGITMHKKFDAE